MGGGAFKSKIGTTCSEYVVTGEVEDMEDGRCIMEAETSFEYELV